MFINPLQNSNLFITPTTVEQLTEIADSMSNSSEAWRMMVFTMNYCHQLVESEMRRDAIERKRVRIIKRPDNFVADDEAKEEEKRILTLNYLLRKNSTTDES
jgi:TPP-dependent indolepyruvate ferredoxin oxidoreductase alpha subunit